jgi:hypothetical protein
MKGVSEHHAGALQETMRRLSPSPGRGPVPAFRIPCTCGWVGAWWRSEVQATNSYERHVRREMTPTKRRTRA